MKPKILFILHLPPPVHGAALVGSYVKASNRINDSFECKYINLSASKSIDAIGKVGLKKSLFFVNLLWSTFTSVLTKRYDLCYVTVTSSGTAFYKDFMVVTILKLFRKKILLHFHNQGVEKGTRANKINRYLYQFVLGGKRTRVILLSPNLYYDVKRYVDQKRVYYCANGISPYNGEMLVKKMIGPTRILFLSNMMVAKGVYVLLEACSLLKKQNVPFECHFVGAWMDITEADFAAKLKELDLSDRVFAHGRKYGQEKDAYYQQSDIFVLPTLNEAFPLVILEAMQFALPVIASEEGGIPDIVSNNQTGYTVPKNDPQQLAAKLETLIHDASLRQEMGIAAKKRFEEHFTIRPFEERLVKIMSEFSGAA